MIYKFTNKAKKVIEIADDIFVVEAGIKYPESAQLGVEYIIPDFSYLVENKKRIKPNSDS